MPTFFRRFLVGCLLGCFLVMSGCGNSGSEPERPGEGADAPVMDEIPDTKA